MGLAVASSAGQSCILALRPDLQPLWCVPNMDTGGWALDGMQPPLPRPSLRAMPAPSPRVRPLAMLMLHSNAVQFFLIAYATTWTSFIKTHDACPPSPQTICRWCAPPCEQCSLGAWRTLPRSPRHLGLAVLVEALGGAAATAAAQRGESDWGAALCYQYSLEGRSTLPPPSTRVDMAYAAHVPAVPAWLHLTKCDSNANSA